MKLGQAIANVVAAALLVAVLSGSVCVVAACSEDCDPCVAKCKCHTQCNHPLALDFDAAHRLRRYRLSVAADAGGGVVRSFSEIEALSLAFAYAPRERSQEDFVRFAQGVIQVNPVLGDAAGADGWLPEPVEVFEASVVVPFARADSPARLSFLFDRRGNLVEIDDVRPAPDPVDPSDRMEQQGRVGPLEPALEARVPIEAR